MEESFSDDLRLALLLLVLAESWTAAERKVARASSESSLASSAGSEARKRMPAEMVEGRAEGDDGDNCSPLSSSLVHSQHGDAVSLLCGEGVLIVADVI